MHMWKKNCHYCILSTYYDEKQDWKDFQSSRLRIKWQYLLNLVRFRKILQNFASTFLQPTITDWKRIKEKVCDSTFIWVAELFRKSDYWLNPDFQLSRTIGFRIIKKGMEALLNFTKPLSLCTTEILNDRKMRPLQIDFYSIRNDHRKQNWQKNYISTMAFRVSS